MQSIIIKKKYIYIFSNLVGFSWLSKYEIEKLLLEDINDFEVNNNN